MPPGVQRRRVVTPGKNVKRYVAGALDATTDRLVWVSGERRLWLAEHGKRLRLHFLPLYCPDDNRIERRVWREVHANVTRNHECETIEQLMGEVVYHLMSRNRTAKRRWLRCA